MWHPLCREALTCQYWIARDGIAALDACVSDASLVRHDSFTVIPDDVTQKRRLAERIKCLTTCYERSEFSLPDEKMNKGNRRLQFFLRSRLLRTAHVTYKTFSGTLLVHQYYQVKYTDDGKLCPSIQWPSYDAATDQCRESFILLRDDQRGNFCSDSDCAYACACRRLPYQRMQPDAAEKRAEPHVRVDHQMLGGYILRRLKSAAGAVEGFDVRAAADRYVESGDAEQWRHALLPLLPDDLRLYVDLGADDAKATLPNLYDGVPYQEDEAPFDADALAAHRAWEPDARTDESLVNDAVAVADAKAAQDTLTQHSTEAVPLVVDVEPFFVVQPDVCVRVGKRSAYDANLHRREAALKRWRLRTREDVRAALSSPLADLHAQASAAASGAGSKKLKQRERDGDEGDTLDATFTDVATVRRNAAQYPMLSDTRMTQKVEVDVENTSARQNIGLARHVVPADMLLSGAEVARLAEATEGVDRSGVDGAVLVRALFTLNEMHLPFTNALMEHVQRERIVGSDTLDVIKRTYRSRHTERLLASHVSSIASLVTALRDMTSAPKHKQ